MKKLREEDGFTLIEMMIVLLIISVLILIAIPNVTKHSTTIDKKGCDAYVTMVEGQMEAYKIEYKKVPTIDKLSVYIQSDNKETKLTCPNGKELEINEGKVQVVENTPTGS